MKTPQQLSVTEETDKARFIKTETDFEPLGKCDLIDKQRSTIIEFGHNKTKDPYRLLAQAGLEMNKHNCCVRFLGAIDEVTGIKCYLDLNNFPRETRYGIASCYSTDTNDTKSDGYNMMYGYLKTQEINQGIPDIRDREFSGRIISEFDKLSVDYPSIEEMKAFLNIQLSSLINQKYDKAFLKLLKENLDWAFLDRSVRLKLGSFHTPKEVVNKAVVKVAKFLYKKGITNVWDPFGGDGRLVKDLKQYMEGFHPINIYYSDINPVIALSGMCYDFLSKDGWVPDPVFHKDPQKCFIFSNPSFEHKIPLKCIEKIEQWYPKVAYGLFFPSYMVPQKPMPCIDGYIALPYKEWQELDWWNMNIPFFIIDPSSKELKNSIDLESADGICRLEFVPPENALSKVIRVYTLMDKKRWKKKIADYDYGICFQEFRSIKELERFCGEFPKIEHLIFANALCKKLGKKGLLATKLNELEREGKI